jgi:hypothetical protein
MFRGFPIGYLLLWDNPVLSGKGSGDSKVIGTGYKGTNIPKSLIIDGQQRLTSLYAVMTGRPVLDHAFKKRHIQIAFIRSKGDSRSQTQPIFETPSGSRTSQKCSAIRRACSNSCRSTSSGSVGRELLAQSTSKRP